MKKIPFQTISQSIGIFVFQPPIDSASTETMTFAHSVVVLTFLLATWTVDHVDSLRSNIATLAPPRVAPPGARPVLVSVVVQPLKLLEVDSVFGIVRIQGYLDQFWNDPRLAVNPSSTAAPATPIAPPATTTTSTTTRSTMAGTTANDSSSVASTTAAQPVTSAPTTTAVTDEDEDQFPPIAYDHMDRSTGRRYYLATAVPWVPDLTRSPLPPSRTNLAPYGDNDPHFANTFTRVYENGDVHLSMLVEFVIPVHFAIEFYPVRGRSGADPHRIVRQHSQRHCARAHRSNCHSSSMSTQAIPGYTVES
jgi:hypothetical protein